MQRFSRSSNTSGQVALKPWSPGGAQSSAELPELPGAEDLDRAGHQAAGIVTFSAGSLVIAN